MTPDPAPHAGMPDADGRAPSDGPPDPAPHSDSAGVPFAGREFQPNPAAGDDGSADPRLTDAVARFRSGDATLPEVIAVLHEVRVLAPLIAERGDEGVGPHGQTVDKTQELALVTVAGPDGRGVLPVFSGVDALAAWNSEARPVPVAASRVALAAAGEGTELLVLDPGSPGELGVRRPAFRALALGEPWIPAWDDADVLAALGRATAGEGAVRDARLAAGDPDARLAAPEVVVELAVEPGLDRDGLDALVRRVAEAWAREEVVAQRVDSVAIRVVAAG